MISQVGRVKERSRTEETTVMVKLRRKTICNLGFFNAWVRCKNDGSMKPLGEAGSIQVVPFSYKFDQNEIGSDRVVQ